MRILCLPLVALALVGAADGDDPDQSAPLDEETREGAEREIPSDSETCRDRINHARDATGQPKLFRREPASPERPLAIYAVDRKYDGCSVMVMMGDPDDVRPLPEVERGPIFRRIPSDPAQ